MNSIGDRDAEMGKVMRFMESSKHIMKQRSEPEEILKVSNLYVQSKGVNILENINFSVEKGNTLAIVGPNGAGKTTLIRAILGLIPYSGTIVWRKGVRIGYVPQSLISADFPISVREFLKFKKVEEIERSLELAGLNSRVLDINLSSLSGGELQRVLLAWAISDFPDVLLFDEPTSFVDIGSEEPIYEKVAHLKEEIGITTLIISHNLHVIAHFTDYILALNRKQLFFGATEGLAHQEIMALMMGSSISKSNPIEERVEEGQ